MEEIRNEILQKLKNLEAMLEALKEQLDNQDEDVRILTEKVDEFIREDAYGSGFSVHRRDD